MINETEQSFNELVDLYSQIIMQSQISLDENNIQPAERIPQVIAQTLLVDPVPYQLHDLISHRETVGDCYKQYLADYMILLVCERDSLGLPELDHLIFEQAHRIELCIEDLVGYRYLLGYSPLDETRLFRLDGYLEFSDTPPTSLILAESTFAMLEASLAANDRQFLEDNLSERDLQLAQDCREVLNSQGLNHDDRIISFQRADGQGKYIITLDRQSDTIFLHSNSHSDLFPNDLILVESKAKILHSKVVDLNADQIRQAVLLLNVEKSQSIEIKNEKNETLTR